MSAQRAKSVITASWMGVEPGGLEGREEAATMPTQALKDRHQHDQGRDDRRILGRRDRRQDLDEAVEAPRPSGRR